MFAWSERLSKANCPSPFSFSLLLNCHHFLLCKVCVCVLCPLFSSVNRITTVVERRHFCLVKNKLKKCRVAKHREFCMCLIYQRGTESEWSTVSLLFSLLLLCQERKNKKTNTTDTQANSIECLLLLFPAKRTTTCAF